MSSNASMVLKPLLTENGRDHVNAFDKPQKLSKESAKAWYRQWQTCLQKNVPELFYGYNSLRSQSERVASYKLTFQSGMKDLLNSSPENLTIYMGCNPLLSSNDLETRNQPLFAPIIALSEVSEQPDFNSLRLQWTPVVPFLNQSPYTVLSGQNEIPPEIAYSYIRNWLKTPQESLADLFETFIEQMNVVTRVKSHKFSKETTESIFDKIRTFFPDVELYIHLGTGKSTPSHPFEFRPVVGVRPTARQRELQGVEYMFDVTYTCPPFCGW